jgi:flagellar basal body P-ring formation protein FlgA
MMPGTTPIGSWGRDRRRVGGLLSKRRNSMQLLGSTMFPGARSRKGTVRCWNGPAGLPKETVVEAARTAMTASSDMEDFDIDLANFTSPIIPLEAEPVATVSDLDRNTGRFSAMLAVTGDAMNPVHMRLDGRIEEVIEAPVCVTRLLPETVIRGGDVRMGRIRKSSLQYGIARSIDRLVGMQLRRPIAAGMPVRLDDLTRPALVQRGAIVHLELQANDLFISSQAVALESGAAGDIIRVQPRNSSMLISAEIISPERARVVMPSGRGITHNTKSQ